LDFVIFPVKWVHEQRKIYFLTYIFEVLDSCTFSRTFVFNENWTNSKTEYFNDSSCGDTARCICNNNTRLPVWF